MIPKIIHYCWFGRNPLPKDALRCIESWRKFLPNYEIKEWNEDNFDVQTIPYVAEAYEAKKYAFVSDYVRFAVLYQEGGVYFDTDVEIIRPIDDILQKGAFMGLEANGTNKDAIAVAPGLGIAAEAGHPLYSAFLQRYETLHFRVENGTQSESMIPIITALLTERGLHPSDTPQEVNGITIYPAEYFNPLDDATGRLRITSNTRSIHWFSATWLPTQSPWVRTLKRYLRRLLGKNLRKKLHLG